MVHEDIPTFADIFYEYIVKHLYNVYIYKMNSLGLLTGRFDLINFNFGSDVN